MPTAYRVFGDLTVVFEEGEEHVVTGRQAAALALLLVAHPDGVRRDRLIDQIWGEDLPVDPEAALYSVISRLRSVVGTDLATTPGGYRMRARSVDSARYEGAVARARAESSLDAMEEAAGIWRGEPYRGLDDIADVELEIERLARVRNWANRDRLEMMIENGLASAAADELAALVSADRFDEETLGLYMQALYDSGRKPAALRSFREYEQLLAEETGLEPSAHIRELEVAILTDNLVSPAGESRPLVPLPMELTDVSTDRGSIAVGRAGAGLPLLVHPGWMSKLDLLSSGLDIRTPMWAELAKRYELVIFDRAGTGLSRQVPVASDLDDSVSEMIAVMTQCFESPVPVLAGSAAGPIAIKAATERPDLFSHLVFHGTYASGPETFPRDVANSLVALVKAGWGMGSDLMTNLLFPSASTEIREAWSQAQREFTDAANAAVLMRQMYDADVTRLLSRLDLPCLVIHYRQDKAIPIWGGEQLARGIPQARFVPLEGRTHYPLPGDEAPVADLIEDFITDTVLTAG